MVSMTLLQLFIDISEKDMYHLIVPTVRYGESNFTDKRSKLLIMQVMNELLNWKPYRI